MKAAEQCKAIPMGGRLADNWVGVGNNSREPLVVLNPKASDMDVMAWVWGEVESLLSLVSLLSEGNVSVEPEQLNAIVVHRLEPMAAALDFALTRGLTERKATAGAPT